MTDTVDNAIANAVEEHLRLMSRLLIARGMTVGATTEILKAAMIAAALDLEGNEISDSRASLLTGVHRKDVKRIRSEDVVPPKKTKLNATARVLALWAADPDFLNDEGEARDLARIGNGETLGFEDLVKRSKVDVAPGTLLKALVDQKAIRQMPEGTLRLERSSAVPEVGSEEQMNAYRVTIAAHLEAATHNILATSGEARFFERALRYSHLSDASLSELDAMAQDMAGKVLQTLNAQARQLQLRDQDDDHTGVFTFGAYSMPKTSGEE